MKVSALIPTYNRRAKVLRAIDSVLAQTVPVDEIVVVDDGSTDGTSDAIRSRYGSRVLLFTQENGGVSAARNRGIREARGEWVAFLDSDDVWLPTKLERQLEALAVLGDEFGFCFTDCVYYGNPELKLSVFQAAGFSDAPRVGSLEEPARYIMIDKEPFWTQSVLVRRYLLEAIGGFDEALLVREDTDVFFRLALITKFCYVSEPLVRIDRPLFREIGVSNLWATRDDRKHDCVKRLYGGWLTIPGVAGTQYERPIRDLLLSAYYTSAECKLHRLKIGPALRELRQVRAMGKSYPSIMGTLASRKIGKVLHRHAGLQAT